MAAIWHSELKVGMKHNIFLEGWGCRLRPVALEDAEFIVNIRNESFAKGCINATGQSVADQKKWLESYFLRSGDFYWIIENTEGKGRIGTIGLYDIVGKEGMPGRWVMLPDAKFLASAPVTLVYEFAFEKIGLKRLLMDVVDSNKKVLKFHDLYGASRISYCPDKYLSQASPFQFIWFEITSEIWPRLKAKWVGLLEEANG